MTLREDQIERYGRHIILDAVGGKGQEKLLSGSVLIVGAGGLGSPAALYLAAAGIGRLGIIDMDDVDISNLQRQVIHFTPDIGRPKVESAAGKLAEINPDCRVETYKERLTAENALSIIDKYDFVIDGTDNFQAKFLVNDACVMAKVPFSHAGVLRFDGQAMTVIPGESACYRCIFREAPPPGAVPTCAEAGVLGVVPGLFGIIQASEAIKYILGTGSLLTDRLLIHDALNGRFREVGIKRSRDCPVCGDSPEITELAEEAPAACEMR